MVPPFREKNVNEIWLWFYYNLTYILLEYNQAIDFYSAIIYNYSAIVSSHLLRKVGEDSEDRRIGSAYDYRGVDFYSR